MNIQQVEKDGFILSEIKEKHPDIAFISLRISLKAFFSTYKALGHRFKNFVDPDLSADEKDRLYTIDYIESACECILHFHNFIELIMKAILREHHILLAVDASKKNEMYYDLLVGKPLDEAIIQEAKSIEFSESLNRLVSLIRGGRIKNNDYLFFVEYKPWLQSLNTLRNRITHRGIFVLRYAALDFLFGEYAFPLLNKILQLPAYSEQKVWKYKQLDAAIDPMSEIVNCFKEGYDREKIALLKELGRAAYENPILVSRKGAEHIWHHFNDDTVKRAEALATHVLKSEYNYDVLQCPVCGVKALVLSDDYADVEDDEGNTHSFRYCYQVKCFCCTFEIDHHISHLDKMKLPIDNFWSHE